jgi:hypothetical protein
MSSWLFRSCSLHLIALALATLLSPPGVRADTNNSGTVNCGDANTKSACIECCTEVVGCGLQISCCPLVGTCTVVNKLTTTGPSLSVKDTAGGLKLQFIRKIGLDGADVLLKVSFLKTTFPKGLVLKAHVGGGDAQVGALLYPILFLGNGDRAPDLLQAVGYDVTIEGIGPTCQSLFPSQLCGNLVFGLTSRIQAALAGGLLDELAAFQAGVDTFGLAVCESTTTSTSTTTTAPPTTTTVTTGSSTTTIPCAFASSGTTGAGVCGGSCPAGMACLLGSPSGHTCSCVPDRQECGSLNCGGECPIQYERCEPLSDGTCGCCTRTGDPCTAGTECCSGEACDLTGHCPPPTTTTPPSSTSTSSTTPLGTTTSTTLCPPGDTLCPGGCVNLSNDNNNCGTCGHVCGPIINPVCISGVCVTP